MREKYEAMSLVSLKEIAKERGIGHLSSMKKKDVIDALVATDNDTAAQPVPESEKEDAAPAARISAASEVRSNAVPATRTSAAPAAGQEEQPARRERVRTTGGMRRDAGRGEEGARRESARGEEGARRESARGEEVARRESARGEEVARRESARGEEGARRENPRREAPIRRDAGRGEAPARREGMRSEAPLRREGSRGEAPVRREGSRMDASRGEAFARREGYRTEGTRGEGIRGESFRDEGGRAEAFRGETSRSEEYRGESYRSESSRAEFRSESSRVETARNEASRGEASRGETSRNETSRGEETNARRDNFDRPPMDLSSLDSGQEVSGILEVLTEGYGFIRSDNFLPGENDVYVAPSQIRRFGLKTGDIICGNTRIRAQQEKFSALLYLKNINGYAPSESQKRYNFEDMTPIFPNQRMRMERSSREIASRVVDLFSPIGKGQRGMIVSPPKAGKTTLLKDVARSILANEKDMHLLILLIDERPEEVTDIREAIVGDNVEVIYSTFDELPEHHKRVSEMGIERAKRLVEYGKDVTILLDSITRLARAYNLTVPPSGRTLSGGLDPAALHMPKRFFGAARNMREGGSLTILATALVDTGSKMDDVVYEEFKGTGNMELVLDRKLSERRIFPAIDIQKSSTRREDLLLTPEEQEAMYIMRKALNGMKSDEAVENILNMFVNTRNNAELVTRVRRQRSVY